MIEIKKIEKCLKEIPNSIDTNDFINIHRDVEGYIKRLIFIGLRLNGVQYNTAQIVLKRFYLDNKQSFMKAVSLSSINKFKLTDFENQNSNLKILINLYFKFTSVYRNYLVHGVMTKFPNEELLIYSYNIDKFLIIEFEKTLKANNLKSAFDKPRAWGAQTTTKKESIEKIIKRLKLGKMTKLPLSINKVIENLEKTDFYQDFPYQISKMNITSQNAK